MKKLLLLFSLLIFISVSSHSQTLPPHPRLSAKHPPFPPHLHIHHHIIPSHHYKHPHKHYYKHKNHAMFNSKIKGENLA